ncbi:MAG: LamG domain-containing protein [Candidatus Kapabacteria bacterium]|nr:LamG domain-containing protein [Candidatus Kapabacteria bacterium]
MNCKVSVTLLIASACVGLIACSSDPASPATPIDQIPVLGLVAYYPFNDNATDASGNGFNGTPLRGVVFASGRSSSAGMAAKFDGVAAFVRVPNARGTRLETKDAFTYSLWLKGDKGAGIYPWSYILTKAAPYGNGFYMKWNHNSEQTLGLYLVEGASGATTPFDLAGINNDEFIGDWHHIVYTWSKATGQMTMYADGSPRAVKKDCRYQGSHSGETLEIGGYDYGATGGTGDIGSFPGAIDDVRIYDRVLTLKEIYILSQEGK